MKNENLQDLYDQMLEAQEADMEARGMMDAPDSLQIAGVEEKLIQQECKACQQVITLTTSDPLIEYCLTCTEELNAWHDSYKISAYELEDWSSQYGEL